MTGLPDIAAKEPSAFGQDPSDGEGVLAAMRPATASSVTLTDRSGIFYRLLDHLECSLALSTDESRLLIIGAAAGTPTLAALVLPDLRGIAAAGTLIACAAGNGVHVFKSIPRLASVDPQAPGAFDAIFTPRAIQFTGRCDFHDMAFVSGALTAVNTRYSCVCILDGQYSFTPIWKPPFITRVLPEDRCHLNGMAIHGAQLRYVTMLGVSDTPGGWRARFLEEGGIVMEAATGRTVAAGLSLPHSPRIIGGRLLVLESGRGRLLEIDPDSGERRSLARLPGFAHGLVERGGVVFVGLSKLRSRRPGSRLPLELDGPEPICGVVALDASSWKPLAVLEISAGAEEVYDLQVLPGIRNADIRGPDQVREHYAVELPNENFWATEARAPHPGALHPVAPAKGTFQSIAEPIRIAAGEPLAALQEQSR